MSITKMRNSFAHLMKPVLIVIALIFFVGVFSMYGGNITGRDENEQTGRRTVASVNGRPISTEAFYRVFQMQYERAKDRGGMSALAEAALKGSLLRQFIDEEMGISAAEQKGIMIGRREIREGREKMVKEHIEQIRQALGGDRKKKLSDKEMNLVLSRQRPPTSIDKLRKELQKGLTKDVVRQQLMIKKLDEQIGNVGSIDDKRLKDSYRQLKVRQIVIGTSSTPEAQAKRKAEEVLKKIKAGGDFAKLVAEFSDDPFTKDKGGDLGFVNPTYDKDLRGLKVGEVSEALKSYQGFRIVKVEDSKIELPADFEKKKKEYRDQLKMTLENQARMEFHEAMQKASKVQVYDAELKGYWLFDKARMAMDPAERDKFLLQAVAALSTATRQNTQSAAAYVTLAQIYQMQEKRDQAKAILEDVLDKRAITEGADLRVMLAQLYVNSGQNDKAKPQLELASEMAYDNPGVHYQLQNMYRQIGESDLAAKEEQWIKEYTERAQAMNPPPTPEPAEKKSKK
ncbi:MAG: peptidylprolyl isomerase [Armatimonadetes bacterium]|nr:peptidylprolyl isomerase [Armatimonadota bacterium]